MKLRVQDDLCKKLNVKILDVNVDYCTTDNFIKIHGHLKNDFKRTASIRKIGVAIEFFDEFENVHYTVVALQHGSFEKTGFTTFYLRICRINERLDINSIKSIQLYPFLYENGAYRTKR